MKEEFVDNKWIVITPINNDAGFDKLASLERSESFSVQFVPDLIIFDLKMIALNTRTLRTNHNQKLAPLNSLQKMQLQAVRDLALTRFTDNMSKTDFIVSHFSTNYYQLTETENKIFLKIFEIIDWTNKKRHKPTSLIIVPRELDAYMLLMSLMEENNDAFRLQQYHLDLCAFGSSATRPTCVWEEKCTCCPKSK